MTPTKKLDIMFGNFQEEVELFFMTKFINGQQLKKTYCDCLDIIYNITGTKDPSRGIIAFNQKYGQGKSFFFEVTNHRHRRKYGKNLFVITSARDLCHLYTSAGNNQNPEDVLLDFINCKNLFIDDIGDELKDGKERSHFGNKLNVIRFVLLERYRLFIDKGFRTFGTTNLTIEEFGQNYDGRVADRILQMTYFMEFKFLANGSFRQLEETRKLTPEEIKANRDRLKIESEREQIDLELYFNELINESDEYFTGKDVSFWSFVKEYLIRKQLLSMEDLEKIDSSALDASELLLRQETLQSKKNQMKHTKTFVRNAVVERALEEITKKDIYNTAENMIARKRFMELRKEKHIFK